MRNIKYAIAIAIVFALVPVTAFGQASTQASIAGVVKDSSGAVLPGVTVEAASPVLIEKTRTTVTGGGGEYKLVELPPGDYTVTFTLTGFTTVRRQGITLIGSVTATVNAELTVGSVSETVTVTGEAPTVDVQSSVRSQTISSDTIADIPVPKIYSNLVNLMPGTTMTGTQDVGGQNGPAVITFTTHGGRTNEGRMELNGMNVGAVLNGGGTGYFVFDIANAQEVQYNSSSMLGEAEVGGGAVNIVAKTGGNAFHGTFYANGANSSLVSSNYTSTLQSQGLKAPNSLTDIWDLDGAVGGPIAKDQLWFFGGARYQGNDKLLANMWQNANCTWVACNPNVFTYAPDFGLQAKGDGRWHDTNLRLTWQASPRNKIQAYTAYQTLCINCIGQDGGSGPTTGAGTSPEASTRSDGRPLWINQASWASPVTNRLLLEAGYINYRTVWGGAEPNPNATANLAQITELCAPSCVNNGNVGSVTYRSVNWNNDYNNAERWQASATYVTGAQSMKFGYQGQWLDNRINNFTNSTNLALTVNNGVPLSLTELAYPLLVDGRVWQHSFYGQDQWTLKRLTLSGALRYDHATSYFPQQQLGPTTFVPTPIVFQSQAGVTGYNDVTPRISAVFDVFGNARTAVKVTTGKYLEAAYNGVAYAGPNPMSLIPTTVTRTWNDTSHTFNPWNDCNLSNPLANGGCGTISNVAFGTAAFSSTYDPAILSGWNVRPSDWDSSVSVQQQLFSRTSVEVGYFRRTFHNFIVTQNLAQAGAGAATPFSVVAPTDPRLPGGGGNTISGLYNVIPALVGQVNLFNTYASNIAAGDSEYTYTNSVDVTVTMRSYRGFTVQGGMSTTDAIFDTCGIKATMPLGAAGSQTITSNAVSANPFCHTDSGYLADYRGLASYLIPKIDVSVAATWQSNPGVGAAGQGTQPGLKANVTYTSAQVAASLGRPLAGVSTVSVNVLEPGALYGQRINQLDLRASKILRFGSRKLNVGIDLYNALNSNAITAYNQTFGTSWLAPTAVLASRFAKVSAQFDF